jgi:hypothetical protein
MLTSTALILLQLILQVICLVFALSVSLLLLAEAVLISLLGILAGAHVAEKIMDLAEPNLSAKGRCGIRIMTAVYPAASCISAFLLAWIFVPSDRPALAWAARIVAAGIALVCAWQLQSQSLKQS